MIVSSEDKRQEYELIKLEHPEYSRTAISRDLIDKKRSMAYSDSWGGRLSHRKPKRPLRYYPCEIEYKLDLINAIKALPVNCKRVINLILSGYNQKEIAGLLVIERSTVSKRYKKAIIKMRSKLCHSEISERY